MSAGRLAAAPTEVNGSLATDYSGSSIIPWEMEAEKGEEHLQFYKSPGPCVSLKRVK